MALFQVFAVLVVYGSRFAFRVFILFVPFSVVCVFGVSVMLSIKV